MYQPIDPFAYIAASKLVETGIDVSNIYDVLYEVDEKSLRFKGYIFSSYKKTEHGVIYLPIPKEVIHEYGIDYNDMHIPGLFFDTMENFTSYSKIKNSSNKLQTKINEQLKIINGFNFLS